jgi:hypothetical protein
MGRQEGKRVMIFEEVLDQAIAMLQRRGRVTYRTLKRQFNLDDEALEDLKEELIEAEQLAVDQDGKMLIWVGESGEIPSPPSMRTSSSIETEMSGRGWVGKRPLLRLIDFAASERESYQKGCWKQ